jgi:protein-tyrosine phosphatase
VNVIPDEALAYRRRVLFDGAWNFRDLGGYPTRSGKKTRWGQVYRSDSLHGLTPSDLVAFDRLGISTIYASGATRSARESPVRGPASR